MISGSLWPDYNLHRPCPDTSRWICVTKHSRRMGKRRRRSTWRRMNRRKKQCGVFFIRKGSAAGDRGSGNHFKSLLRSTFLYLLRCCRTPKLLLFSNYSLSGKNTIHLNILDKRKVSMQHGRSSCRQKTPTWRSLRVRSVQLRVICILLCPGEDWLCSDSFSMFSHPSGIALWFLDVIG